MTDTDISTGSRAAHFTVAHFTVTHFTVAHFTVAHFTINWIKETLNYPNIFILPYIN
jgi:hypothetical protein